MVADTAAGRSFNVDPVGGQPSFAHGVASGDPAPHRVLVWTRVSAPPTTPVVVRWRVGTTREFHQVVAQGEAVAGPDHDFTVKVDVDGLEPSTTYYYGFETDGATSPVGRTRTTPVSMPERVRLGVVCCASWPHGFFNAYGHLAGKDVDLVVHVGDYIYEDAGAWEKAGRVHQPATRLRTLDDYRARHAQYRTDPQLQRLHQRHPVVAVWDDHDLAGDAWRDGAGDHDPAEDGDWNERKAAAVKAYLEWLPVRVPDSAQPQRIYRTVALGDLADLIVLETRLAGRDRPAKAGQRAVGTIDDRNRSLLGADQRSWLRGELQSSRRWHLIANQVMMAPLRAIDVPRPLRRLVGGLVAGGAGVNPGQWDGYPSERAALFEFLADERLDNVVVVSGDLHSSWAGELTLDPKGHTPAVGVEFVTPSVTSPCFAESVAPPLPGSRALLRRLVARANPHWRFFDLERHGYLILDVDAERVRAEFWHVDTVARHASGERLAATCVVKDGEPRVIRGGSR